MIKHGKYGKKKTNSNNDWPFYKETSDFFLL